MCTTDLEHLTILEYNTYYVTTMPTRNSVRPWRSLSVTLALTFAFTLTLTLTLNDMITLTLTTLPLTVIIALTRALTFTRGQIRLTLPPSL